MKKFKMMLLSGIMFMASVLPIQAHTVVYTNGYDILTLEGEELFTYSQQHDFKIGEDLIELPEGRLTRRVQRVVYSKGHHVVTDSESFYIEDNYFKEGDTVVLINIEDNNNTTIIKVNTDFK